MAIRFMSDTHWRHRNIIKYTSRIDIYEDVDQMGEDMIRRWNEVVAPDDIVYHLGDFAFGSKEVVKEIVRRLNGRIRLILGNHDKRNKPEWYAGLGFDRVYDTPIILEDWFIISHEPIKYLPPHVPMINIHGHTHDECFDNPQRINVCWEILDGYPVSFEEIKAHCAFLDGMTEVANRLFRERHDEHRINWNEGYIAGRLEAQHKGN